MALPLKTLASAASKNWELRKTARDNWMSTGRAKAGTLLTTLAHRFRESIENFIPEDTSVKDLKIHLLDVDSFLVPTDSIEYGIDSLRSYVIVVYNRNLDKCIFDPYKTGKYPKPKQWQD